MVSPIKFLKDEKIHQIPLSQIEISGLNVRRRDILPNLDELADSMDRFGPLQPVLVEQRGPDRFAVVIGQRRYLAARQLKWETLPALIIRSGVDPLTVTLLSLSENIQRRDLSREDKVRIFTYLLGELKSIKAVAQTLGITETTVRKWVGYAAVPQRIKDLVKPGGLTVNQARRINENVQDEQTGFEVAQRLVGLGLPKESKDRVLRAVAEMPDRSPDRIFSYADELQYQRDIHFILTEASAHAIEDAAADMGIEADEVAHSATEEWLEDSQYLKKGP